MSKKSIFLIMALVSFVCGEEQPRQKHPDVGLNVIQLIAKYGYPLENHTVETEDGYILKLHRIPHGRHNGRSEGKPAVLFMPGLLCSSVDWVNMGPERSLGFILADQGYDVWLANYRGTTWSRKHIKLNPDVDKKQFWNYSFHEIAIYDTKRFIDYILNTTTQKNLFYIGHSQGTTTFLTLISEKPQYNDKIRLAILLAPITYVKYIQNPLARFFETYKNEIETFAEKNQFYELLPHYPAISSIGELFCHDGSPFQNICTSIFYFVAGYSPKQLNKTMLPVITSNTPAGSSLKQWQHFAQFAFFQSFHQFNYGEHENLIKYGQPTAPEYNISQVTSPLVLYYGTRDALCSEKDAEHLAAQLPNVVLKRRIQGFNHLDYMWGIDAVKLIFSEILNIMRRY